MRLWHPVSIAIASPHLWWRSSATRRPMWRMSGAGFCGRRFFEVFLPGIVLTGEMQSWAKEWAAETPQMTNDFRVPLSHSIKSNPFHSWSPALPLTHVLSVWTFKDAPRVRKTLSMKNWGLATFMFTFDWSFFGGTKSVREPVYSNRKLPMVKGKKLQLHTISKIDNRAGCLLTPAFVLDMHFSQSNPIICMYR